MTLQILSDLHLEAPKAYDIFNTSPKAPYLALIGDIGTLGKDHKDDFLSFLTRQLQQFRIVFFVAGNHEAYHTTWPDALKILQKFEQEVSKDNALGEFIFLNRKAYTLPGTKIVILGCSLFSQVPDKNAMNVELRLNDFFSTEGWTVAQHNAAHTQDLSWLNEEVKAWQNSTDIDEIIILTHWSPSTDPRSIDPKHRENNPIGCAFSTDLYDQPCVQSEKVQTWVFGHTHYNCDFQVDRWASPLRLVTNQRGYYFAQSAGFDETKTLGLQSLRSQRTSS